MVKLVIWMCSQKLKSWSDSNYDTLTIINFSLHAWINVLTSRPKLFYLYYKDQKNGHEYKLLITYSLFLLVFHFNNSKIPPELGRTCKDRYQNTSGQILVRDMNLKSGKSTTNRLYYYSVLLTSKTHTYQKFFKLP